MVSEDMRGNLVWYVSFVWGYVGIWSYWRMTKQKVFRITLDVCNRTQSKKTGVYRFKMLQSASKEIDVFSDEEIEKLWETYIPLVFKEANEEKDLERKENND